MEFGRLPYEQLDEVDFNLPPEPARNAAVLNGQRDNPKVYVGMPEWGSTKWVGKIYPKLAKAKEYVSYYAKQFNAIEFNATHYRLWEEWKLAQWAGDANSPGFLFCPKMYNGITHKGSISKKNLVLAEFLKNMEGLGEHLGPIYIQTHDGFGDNRRRELFEFAEQLPADGKQFFFEFRNPGLLTNEALFDYLQTKNIGVVITDSAGRRDCVHMKLTVPKIFIRCIFNDHPSDKKRIIDWANRINHWVDKGMKEVYFFVHGKDDNTSLGIAQEVITTFNDTIKLEIPTLKFINKLK